VTLDPAKFNALDRKLDTLLARLAPPQRFLGVDSAASYADLSPDSIRRMVERGDLTGLRPVRGRVLIDRLELDQVILAATNRPCNGRGMSSGGTKS